ncbi:MAG: tRNA (adenosine(37)-N6)-threonylcarbamoyltransferase complex ATPase subunit type 1 TsaE [Victivallales bacterium]|nr:tRNA (adenosine(37)-N6)-threonylcarbamoyltransferase complex ATPase subunit type 1 TsaE [Victivallales bacterium]
MNKQVVETFSERQTEEFAADLARQLQPGSVVALHGDLGAGKTVFSRGFARGLGITEPISSPTYTIIQEYKLPDERWFFHLDLYRIDNYIAALAFGVEEYLDNPDAFVVLEWPLRIKELLPPHTIHIQIEHIAEESRRITIR